MQETARDIDGDCSELNGDRRGALERAIRARGTKCVIDRACERYYRRWLSYAGRFFPAASDLARDVVHDALIDLLRNKKADFTRVSKVNIWMRKGIHGAALRTLGVRKQEVGLDDEAEAAGSLDAAGPSPQRRAMRNERATRLRQVLQEVTPEEREAYVLRFLAQRAWTVTAIAEKHGVTRQTASARIRSVLSRMESRFDD